MPRRYLGSRLKGKVSPWELDVTAHRAVAVEVSRLDFSYLLACYFLFYNLERSERSAALLPMRGV